ncbi:cyclic-di-AMP-binding protein CbpB [Melissococcus plutonius]|uniref:CBS domain containing protein n=1 Tax=Melissococcus plutonius (strain ATCC 35311 / DSM 29964 / CIP 104052 / LMG 20360 / NCIMB 702443) TaxID=940190 RepID=F3YAD7_MELPT|nr:cyclic-di-AMP-binding protein CbpB [Melissococcus plutonius]AIM24945.1 CBS domain containing protein [Melissococcus plutonius S1]KMT25091.1 CBS domain containing protein [Melissococcus plutonius]KMT26728.1 CBS domain containing protein [Melissococcus plutonius]KMT27978.1 CBS domain containing protein [Melissococcus plutonius]KMT29751.1 CBS domain containing protein [Melissococcus plutonius]
MIGTTIEKLMLEKAGSFLIPAENVANVMSSHPLNHAVLVLSKVKYSKIPVLDKNDQFVGLISLADIMGKMFSITSIDLKNLNKYTVSDVMEREVTVIHEDWELEDVLHFLVDTSFLPVVDKYQCFKGIITRKEILKAVNHLAHELEKSYVVLAKSSEEDKKDKIKIS